MGDGLFTTISAALGILLLISLITILVRKLIIEYDDGYNGAVIPIVIVFLIGLVCSLVALAETIKIDIRNLSFEEITHTKNSTVIALAIGFGSLFFLYIIFKIIGKRVKNKRAKSKYESRWDLDKINKSGF